MTKKKFKAEWLTYFCEFTEDRDQRDGSWCNRSTYYGIMATLC
jgi:hypothetical protein